MSEEYKDTWKEGGDTSTVFRFSCVPLPYAEGKVPGTEYNRRLMHQKPMALYWVLSRCSPSSPSRPLSVPGAGEL